MSSVPGGTLTTIGRKQPSFIGIVGSVTARSAKYTPESVTP